MFTLLILWMSHFLKAELRKASCSMLQLPSLGIQSYLLRYGDWRHSYVGFDGPVVPSEVWYDWIPKPYQFVVTPGTGPIPSTRHSGL